MPRCCHRNIRLHKVISLTGIHRIQFSKSPSRSIKRKTPCRGQHCKHRLLVSRPLSPPHLFTSNTVVYASPRALSSSVTCATLPGRHWGNPATAHRILCAKISKTHLTTLSKPMSSFFFGQPHVTRETGVEERTWLVAPNPQRKGARV